ncbi:MAG TPA: 4-hydroxythreonine-4-phosphate dehydrogenase PdxA [Pseudomonadales bacterium]|nr:4-hydroxythreonine-4-phosphate dehydrogenase PdxA [Pseudomonadales bacterium]
MSARLVITAGEPAGIGPELLARLAQVAHATRWVVATDAGLLAERASATGVDLRLQPFDPADDGPDKPGTLRVLHVPLAVPSKAGVLDARNAPHVLTLLERAVDGCLDGTFDAMVTAPVHKGVIADAGTPFTGHTEFLAQRTHARAVLMVLTADRLRVALVTTHLPLAQVPAAITRPRVTGALELLIDGLRERYGIDAPRILVAGLNPHAGEGGHLGREEIDVITPVCERFRERGIDVRGPLPADTLFTPDRLADADAVLAMYHDQGLPVLKHAGFGRAVNVTFGLPIIRTSVDHGTALDIAGTGRADAGSLLAAIEAAEQMALRRRELAA